MRKFNNISRRLFFRTSGTFAAGLTIIPGTAINEMHTLKLAGLANQQADGADADPKGEGTVTITQGKVEIKTPYYLFKLDTSDGLQAVSWKNRLTGRSLSLGGGPEVGFDIGLPDQLTVTPKLQVTSMPAENKALTGEAVFTLESKEPKARVTVIYRWNVAEPVLRKFVAIENLGDST